MTHGRRGEEARRSVGQTVAAPRRVEHPWSSVPDSRALEGQTGPGTRIVLPIAKTLLGRLPVAVLLGFPMMDPGVLYNAIFFSRAGARNFYHIPSDQLRLLRLPVFALGNLAVRLLLGHCSTHRPPQDDPFHVRFSASCPGHLGAGCSTWVLSASRRPSSGA